jgi:branched-chain amino acid transport system ATP-binding protein
VTALLQASGVGLSFAGVQALADVSLEVPEGALFAVIGPNGAGKTSLFNCVSGVYRPQAGRITFDGIDVVREAPWSIAARGVARMFQNLALFEHMTVLDNLMLGCHHRFRVGWIEDALRTRRSRAEEVRHRSRAEEIIDFLDLARHRMTPVGVLPYGVLKRVELGRALCMGPRLLLLDEPAAGLNQEETEDMARYLLDIKEELGLTQVLIEHDLGFVLDLADTIAVLDFGRKVAEGPPAEIRERPEVAAAYLGT